MDAEANTPTPAIGTDGINHSRYTSQVTNRQPYLTRGWDCSELTIPSILPRNGHSSATTLPTPWQSLGARCVNNLSSKLLMTAMPSNQPFFRMKMDEILVAKLMGGSEQDKNQKTDLDSGLQMMERAVQADVEMSGDRVSAFEAFKHLITTGNALLHDSKLGLRVYHLDHYVVRRDPLGDPLEMIAFEQVDPVCLPDDIQGLVKEKAEKEVNGNAEAPVDMYTRVLRRDKDWLITQEVVGKVVITGTYPIDECPWIPLRFTKIDGENYGRGYVEEYLGDFTTTESLSQSLAEGAKAAAKLLLMVKPNGTTRLKAVQDARNGDIISGNAEEVTTLQAQKFADFQTAEKRLEAIEQRLELAFLLNTAVQRNGDRVTAEEIRFMAQELENTLGGFYTILSKEFQLPYVKSKMAQMRKANRLPVLPKGLVKPTIVTGMDAMGRSMDRQKLLGFMQDGAQALTPPIFAQYVNVSELLTRLSTADGIDKLGLIKTDEEVQAAQQQQQQQAMMSKLGPSGITAGGKLAQEVMKNGQGVGATGASQAGK